MPQKASDGTTWGLFQAKANATKATQSAEVATQAERQATEQAIAAEKAKGEAESQRQEAEPQKQEAVRQTAVVSAVSAFQSKILSSADPARKLGDKVTVLQAVRDAITSSTVCALL